MATVPLLLTTRWEPELREENIFNIARLHRTTNPGFRKIRHGAFLESKTCISHTSPSVFENPELRGEARQCVLPYKSSGYYILQCPIRFMIPQPNAKIISLRQNLEQCYIHIANILQPHTQTVWTDYIINYRFAITSAAKQQQQQHTTT